MEKKADYKDKFLKYLFDTYIVIIPMILISGVLFSELTGAPKLISLVFMVIAGIIIGIMSVTKNFFKFMKPIIDISKEIRRMSSGDLTGKISVNGKGEVQDLVFDLNKFLNMLKVNIEKVDQGIITLSNNSNKLSGTAKAVTSNAEDMLQRSETVVSAGEEASTRAVSVSASIGKISESIKSIDSSIQVFNTSFGEIRNNCSSEVQSVESASKQFEEARDSVHELSAATEDIRKIADLIEDFADQTNLLALNATIEAASAGEAGKGFAVVASEVKDLARQVAKASNEIRENVERMKTISMATESALKGIDSTFDDVKHFSRNIVVSIDEQTQTVTTVTEQITNVDSAAQEVTRFTHESTDGLKEISNQMHHSNQAAINTLKSMNVTSESINDLVNLSQNLQGILKNYNI